MVKVKEIKLVRTDAMKKMGSGGVGPFILSLRSRWRYLVGQDV